ncbi:MAG: DUF1343 domain-containing protein [Cyclobacteriaceae bacterium]
MNKMMLLVCLPVLLACTSPSGPPKKIMTGAERTDLYLSMLKGKSIGLTVNHTSNIKDTHLVDSLISLGIDVQAVYSPEHGFRGTADAGEKVENELTDKFKIFSLYGKNKKPFPDQLSGIDIMIFDIQDVGARFYTYISTMHYIMEACSELGIPVIILDRPNPNGHYVDGPVLDTAFQSFVGMHPIPVVHGMTIGELAGMINEEKWLANGITCDLNIIPLKNWAHDSVYSLPKQPSPNLPNDIAVTRYPSLCFFEGTIVSIGRGTSTPFQQFGHPRLTGFQHSFTPQPGPGAKYPKLEGEECYGIQYIPGRMNQIDLTDLINAYNQLKQTDTVFFNSFFSKLAGTDQLQSQIESGMTMDEIRASWQDDLNAFREKRKAYLLYP